MFNTTDMDLCTSFWCQVIESNKLVNGWLSIVVIAIFWIIIFGVSIKRNPQNLPESTIAASFGSLVISFIFWLGKATPFEAVSLCFVLTILGILYKKLSSQ